MEKFTTTILVALGAMLCMSAQDSYYCYKEGHMPMYDDATKIVSIAPNTDDSSEASGLEPEYCTIGDRPAFWPIPGIMFSFRGNVDVKDNSVATIYCGDKVVATGDISSQNYEGITTQGFAVISFDEPLLLPKGFAYDLVVPEDVIYLKATPSVTNDILRVTFEVPATLGTATPTIENGSVVASARSLGFYFGTETEAVGESKMVLYREGVPIRAYDCHVSWDWDLGSAMASFGGNINFEAGVRYSLRLPAGSVSALYRPDIVNEEAELHFIGGYTEPVKQIKYVWCSLLHDHPTDFLGEVLFYYNQEVVLSCNPVVKLVVDDTHVVKEVVPTLTAREGQWILAADFENEPLEAMRGYSVIIPEGTLVAPKGDVLVNACNVMPVTGSNGISQTGAEDAHIIMSGNTLTVSGVKAGTEIKLYSLDGALILSRSATSDIVNMQVSTPGVYIVSINGQSQTIAVK